MADPWLFAGAPEPLSPGQVTLIEGTSFCISDVHGNLGGQSTDGLFARDTRVLSGWHLALEGRVVSSPTVVSEAPHHSRFLALSSAEHGGRFTLLLTRDRYVGEGMREDLELRSTIGTPQRLRLVIRAGADFADLFEVKERRAEQRAARTSADAGRLVIASEDESSGYATTIDTDGHVDPEARTISWDVELSGHGSWRTSVLVEPTIRGHRLQTPYPRGVEPGQTAPALRRRQFRTSAPGLWTSDRALIDVLSRSIEDLATLRIFDPDDPDQPVVAAGAPWFMALFGRDSLLTSLMLLPVDPHLTLGTLRVLGAHQGTGLDALSEEEPGRILHEMRFGPAGSLDLGGRPAYFGSADSTPLFALAVGELYRWAPAMVTPDLIAQMDRALAWTLSHGDPDADGFVEYHRKTPRGLANQGWKDSWDGINFADGTIATSPIALAEVQGYTYAAFLARAAIADGSGEPRAAAGWRARAARLKVSFNERFWLPDRGWFAVGLDHDKRPIDALTSNNGHCLWTGIADADKAAVVAEHLVSPEMFTGWGVRTLATSMGAFDPLSYHNGSVWPHDTAICVGGLARYGHTEQAARIAVGLLDAAPHFNHRLPELFGGFARDDVPVPVAYPAACSPQAWASAAPVELVRALVGLEPDVRGLRCSAHLPERFLPFRLSNVSYGGDRYDVVVDRSGGTVRRVGGPASGLGTARAQA